MKWKKYVYVMIVIYIGVIVSMAEHLLHGDNRTMITGVVLSLLLLIMSTSGLIMKVMRMKE